ncbi:MAG: cation diffusion facilitator family transporter [Acidimicrobiales bacterium]
MTREARLRAALVLNGAIVVVQLAGGLLAHSMAVLADAGHNLADVGGLALALLAVRMARRAPTARRSFGWHRSSILAAQANALGVVVVAAVVAFEAVNRLVGSRPAPVRGGVVLVLGLLALAGNGAAALVARDGSADLNVRAVVLHLLADVIASAAVGAVGLVILVGGGTRWLDPAVSIGIAVLVAVQALGLIRATADVLLEATPAGLEIADVVSAMQSVRGVEAVHDLHVWCLSSEVWALSAHVILDGHPTLEEAQLVGQRVKATVAGRFGIAHATLELECETCAEPGAECDMGGAAASVPAGARGSRSRA